MSYSLAHSLTCSLTHRLTVDSLTVSQVTDLLSLAPHILAYYILLRACSRASGARPPAPRETSRSSKCAGRGGLTGPAGLVGPVGLVGLLGLVVAGEASGRGLVTGLITGAMRPSVRKPVGELLD